MNKDIMNCIAYTLILFSIIFFQTTCIKTEKPISQTISGEWESKPIRTELGRIVYIFSFKEDSTYISHMEFIDFQKPMKITSEGSYSIKQEKIILMQERCKGKQKKKVHNLDIGKNCLIMNEDGEIFKFKKKK